MPDHKRPLRQSVKKAQGAAAHAKAEAEREKAAARARRAAAAESSAKKRTAKASVDSMTDEFAKMKNIQQEIFEITKSKEKMIKFEELEYDFH